RAADAVRRELGQPLSPQRRDQVRRHVQATLDQVSAILSDAQSTRSSLPAPSLRALEFLERIDWDQLPTSEEAPVFEPARHGKWRGLARFGERAMDDLDEPLTPSRQEAVRESMDRMSRQI